MKEIYVGWPKRAADAAKDAGIKTLEQANAMSDLEWLRIPGCGRYTLRQIRQLTKQDLRKPEISA